MLRQNWPILQLLCQSNNHSLQMANLVYKLYQLFTVVKIVFSNLSKCSYFSSSTFNRVEHVQSL